MARKAIAQGDVEGDGGENVRCNKKTLSLWREHIYLTGEIPARKGVDSTIRLFSLK